MKCNMFSQKSQVFSVFATINSGIKELNLALFLLQYTNYNNATLEKYQRIIFQYPVLLLPILSIYFFSTSEATARETVLLETPISDAN